MQNFKKGGFKKGGGGFGGRSRFGGKGGGRGSGDRHGRPMELFPAVCAECRKDCEVPFRPTNEKPVYCRDCFGKQRHVPGRNSNGADGPRADFQRDFVPRRERQPEYERPQNDEGINAMKQKLDSLESKVDRIIELVSEKPKVSAPVTTIVKVASKAKEAKKAKSSVRKTATNREK